MFCEVQYSSNICLNLDIHHFVQIKLHFEMLGLLFNHDFDQKSTFAQRLLCFFVLNIHYNLTSTCTSMNNGYCKVDLYERKLIIFFSFI